MKTLIASWLPLAVALSANAVELPSPAFVDDCQPCSIAVREGFRPHNITFQIKPSGDASRVVSGLQISHDGKSSYLLDVSAEMLPVKQGATIFFGGVDINFDGYSDLMLITRRGIANAYADYWLYSPAVDRFDPLGNYPVFTAETAKRQLTSFERGGMGGTISDTKRYAFVDGKLTLMMHEQQQPDGTNGVITSVWEYKNGGKRLVSRKRTSLRSSGR